MRKRKRGKIRAKEEKEEPSEAPKKEEGAEAESPGEENRRNIRNGSRREGGLKTKMIMLENATVEEVYDYCERNNKCIVVADGKLLGFEEKEG